MRLKNCIVQLLILCLAYLFTSVSSSSEYDVDGNGVDDPLTDGLLVLRHQFGLSGSALTAGTLASNATVTDPSELANYIDERTVIFDLDGNGFLDPLTDGLLLLRYLFGLSGDAMTNGVIGLGATRDSYSAINAHIDSSKSAIYLLSGKVIGGYLSQAKVCLDTNKNLTCDDGENHVFTDETASYTLEVNIAPRNFTLLAEAIPDITKDAAAGTINRPYTLMAPAELKNGINSNNITVFTTLLSTLLNDDPSILNTKKTTESLQSVLQISAGIDEPIGSDFIANGSEQTRVIAVSFVSLLQEIQQPLITGSNEALTIIKQNNVTGATPSAILSAIDIATQNKIFNYSAAETQNVGYFKIAPTFVANSSEGQGSSSSNLVEDEIPLVVSDTLGGEKEVPSIQEELTRGIVVAGEDSNPKIQDDGECRYDYTSIEKTVELITLNGSNVTSSKYYLDDINWQQPCTGSLEDSDTYVLSEAGWVIEQNFGTNGYSFDDNCLIENEVPDGSVTRSFCATTGNYGGEQMSSVLPYLTFENPTDTFPAGSRGFDVTWIRNTDRVEVYTLLGGGSSSGKIWTSADSKSLEEFLTKTIEKYKNGENQDIWYQDDVHLRFISYDNSSKVGEVVWFDKSKPYPDKTVGVRPFEVRSIFGKPVALLDRNGYSTRAYGAQEFTNRPIFTFLADGDVEGIITGIYRGDLEIPKPSRHHLGQRDLDRFVNPTFIDAVYDAFGIPKFPR